MISFMFYIFHLNTLFSLRYFYGQAIFHLLSILWIVWLFSKFFFFYFELFP